jgi:hypothetical protein
MKLIEILNLNRKSLEILQKYCIKTSDVSYLQMYHEYESMMKDMLKKSYIIAHLSHKYRISERKVYYLIKKFERDCKIGAV